MCKAIEVANWFINNEYTPINSMSGNLKLNKLLYFAQLISLIKREKPLFKDELYAFKNGVVVENIRKEYNENFYKFIDRAKYDNTVFESDELSILEFTKEIFMNVSAEELSDLTHEHKSWKENFEKSKEFRAGKQWYNKEISKIEIEDYFTKYKCDLELVKNIIDAKECSQNDNNEDVIEVNGVKFYYNPEELNVYDYIETLKAFSENDGAYTLYLDDTQGLVIF
ncbi:Panacea domain-containing protein [Clostridium perfringens]|uniref:Panacea domain-containing protein n=1 Tax=Clostridium perfringens TaxID=1502 RepID=UPI000D71485A|nr:type II toxin-antitoxin system antitoxin SocA domain-containing protein [Clostridium perfringens]MDK0649708.1 DUF4065 domain-containing protein [Clostridium perfringens]MDK0865500.1 DUF4065 domain-containing protein [Clostridium perfringens]PWX03254.1 hypothetical protein CYK71_08490 [Clostridium perfringens]